MRKRKEIWVTSWKKQLTRFAAAGLCSAMLVGTVPAGVRTVSAEEAVFSKGDEGWNTVDGGYYDSNKDGVLSVEEVQKIKDISADSKSSAKAIISKLKYFTGLEVLMIRGAGITELDVSKNTKLIELNCSENKLTKLDVSKNTELTELNCSKNKISKLDVSKNIGLFRLECFENKITKLDVSKNANLYDLNCSGNQITKLDVSKNKKLEALNCSNNKLSKLDVSKNKKLGSLECSGNKLSKLDISKNTALYGLKCKENKIKKLNISKNKQLDLYSLDCDPSVDLGLKYKKNLNISMKNNNYCGEWIHIRAKKAGTVTFTYTFSGKNKFCISEIRLFNSKVKGFPSEYSIKDGTKVYSSKKQVHSVTCKVKVEAGLNTFLVDEGASSWKGETRKKYDKGVRKVKIQASSDSLFLVGADNYWG